MSEPHDIDGVLVQWGDRLIYPGNRIVKDRGQPRLTAVAIRARAAFLRNRIAATVVRRAPQVMVKVIGGGRGMQAITAHLRYISKNGRLPMENDRGEVERGRAAVRDVAEEWRFGGSTIPEVSHRREAHNILLSMPRGVDPAILQRAAREFAQAELAGHKYVMVLHDHQANPHVHISVRAESRSGRRLNPRKADLQRWRETFAEKLRGWGIEAEASRQAVRGESRNYPALWRIHAKEEGRERKPFARQKSGARAAASRAEAGQAWSRLAAVLSASACGRESQGPIPLEYLLPQHKCQRRYHQACREGAASRGSPRIVSAALHCTYAVKRRLCAPAPCSRRSHGAARRTSPTLASGRASHVRFNGQLVLGFAG